MLAKETELMEGGKRMQTETSSFIGDTRAKEENKVVMEFLKELEEKEFTMEQVKHILTRMGTCIASAEITCKQRTPFKTEMIG